MDPTEKSSGMQALAPAIDTLDQDTLNKISQPLDSTNATEDERSCQSSSKPPESEGHSQAVVEPPNTPVAYTVLFKDSKGRTLQTMPSKEKEFDDLKESARHAVLEVKKIVRVVDQAYTPPQNVAKNKISSVIPSRDKMTPFVEAVEAEQIIIYSPRLIKAVKQAVKYWPSLGFVRARRDLLLDRPYRSIGASRTEFHKLLSEYDSLTNSQSSEHAVNVDDVEECRQTAEEIRLLMHEVDKAQADFDQERIKHNKQEDPVTSFDSLWMLFTPGTIVYHNTGGEEIAYMVKMCQWSRDPQLDPSDPVTQVSVFVWNLDFNGTSNAPGPVYFYWLIDR